MADPLKRVTQGDKISSSAATHNALCDAAEYVRTLKSYGGKTRPDIITAELLIRVQNTSGSDVDRFGILAIDEPLFDAGDSDALPGFIATPIVKGVSPTLDNWGRFLVTTEPIAAGRIGNAVISGVVPCKINIFKTNHWWADVKDGDLTQLNSDDCGNAMIVSKEGGTGEGKWAYLLLGIHAVSGFCVAQEDIHPNDAGSFKFSTRSGDVYGAAVDMIWAAGDEAGTILTGKVCFRTRIGKEWIVSPKDCPDDA